jgi:Trk K+ transport system NAD-binding subunit
VNAPLSIWEEKLWTRFEESLTKYERNVRHLDQQIISLGSAEYLVVGMGNAGMAAYDRLKKEEKNVVGMDIDPARIEGNLSEGRRVIYGDMQDDELWNNLNLNTLESIIMAIGTPEAKVNATKLMRSNNFKGSIYALTFRNDEQKALADAGASAVCMPITQAGRKLAELSLSDDSAPEDMVLNPEFSSQKT